MNCLLQSTPIDSTAKPVDGKYVAEFNGDPTQTEVTVGGQPLPAGSVVRNTVDGQKFVKIAGDSKAFQAISVSVKSEWNLAAGSDASWAVLQGF